MTSVATEVESIEQLDFEAECGVYDCHLSASWTLSRRHVEGTDCESGPICAPHAEHVRRSEANTVALATIFGAQKVPCVLHGLPVVMPSTLVPL